MENAKTIDETDNYFVDDSGFSHVFLDAWTDMRAATRRLITENPPEARLLFYVLLSDLVFFLSWTMKTIVSPATGAANLIPMEIGVWLVAALMLRTASMYVLASVVALVARLCGGQGSWKETRAAVFYGAFISSPFGLLAAMLTVLLVSFEEMFPIVQEGWVAMPPYWIGLIPFVWFISAGVAEAHKFRATAPIFMVMSSLALAALIGGLYLRGAGVI
jgi:Yip1-like protein